MAKKDSGATGRMRFADDVFISVILSDIAPTPRPLFALTTLISVFAKGVRLGEGGDSDKEAGIHAKGTYPVTNDAFHAILGETFSTTVIQHAAKLSHARSGRRGDKRKHSTEMSKKSIACLVFDGFQSLDVFGPLDVFAEANTLLPADDGYDICVVATSIDPVTASNGVKIAPDRTIDTAQEAFHTVIVAGGPGVPFGAPSPAMLAWLHTASEMSRRCCSICTGAFILGHAGLLAGKTATTHWQHAERFRVTFPETKLDADRIYARDGKLVTSAGVTAGIDLALALVREDHGAEVALKVAKRLLVIAQRQGGQSQFSPLLTPLPAESSPIAKAIDFIHRHLNRRLENGVLAEVACMSVRNFGRTFQNEMGITPAQYVERQRIELAKFQLETGGKTLKQICFDCGFGSSENMRLSFLRNINTTPARYRELFSFEKS